MLDPAYVEPAARGISKRCQCISGTAGATQASNYGMTQTQHSVGSQPALISSYAAQQHCQDGRSIKLRDARGVYFEPETSYINHYPEKVIPEHTPLPEAPITGVPFTASTEYDNQYLAKSLAFNQIGTLPSVNTSNKSGTHKLPLITSETTNQHDFPYWDVVSPQKKGYAVRRVSAAPPLDFLGDTFTTTNAVEYQAKPLSYVPPTGRTVVQPLSSAADKHTTYSCYFQPKSQDTLVGVPKAAPAMGPPFEASTTYDNEYVPKPLPNELPHLAGIQAASALGVRGPRQSVGVQVEGGAYCVMLPHSLCAPCSAKQVFTTTQNHQSQACISVLYGQSSNAVNNRVLGQFDMAVIPSQAGVPQIEVTCSLDAGLRLTVVARDVDSGRQKVWQQGSSAA